MRCVGRQAGGERADDDRIVAGEHDVDHQHLAERGSAAGLPRFAKSWTIDAQMPARPPWRARCQESIIAGELPAAYWFIEAKKSSLVLESFILSSRNCIASTVPICIRMRRSTHILESLP